MQSWAAVAHGEMLGPRCDSGPGLGLQRKAASVWLEENLKELHRGDIGDAL